MSSNEERPWRQDNLGVFGELPGDLMMWVLIASELLVFGAALIAFLAVRATDPAAFSADQALLDRTAGALNTIVLVTSGLCAGLRRRLPGARTAVGGAPLAFCSWCPRDRLSDCEKL